MPLLTKFLHYGLEGPESEHHAHRIDHQVGDPI